MAHDEQLSGQQTTGDDRATQDRAQTEADESDPGRRLGELDDALDTHDYPTTDAEIVDAYGEYEVETRDGWEPLAELLDPGGGGTYDSADDVRREVLKVVNRR